eukprot:3936298-Rhodomonas_salina.1
MLSPIILRTCTSYTLYDPTRRAVLSDGVWGYRLLVNDFLIQAVEEEEVTCFEPWRTPALLYYARHNFEQ